uniref:Myosin motor domain-containing protein n=1 Tax=Arcella intermedia TaxID=1963864 RepID=A0A6B2L309_9EUKA
MDQISEAIILHNIKERYDKDLIYTFIGPMLISMNPFRKLDQYGEHLIPEYAAKPPKEDLLPHIYHIAQNAYKSIAFAKSQSVVISGESGAGKTEATKIILKFLCDVSDQTANASSTMSLAKSILATNPILEAFGNAKTIRNNNSSRFGKFIRILFNSGGTIVGAKIDNYLLENTRIIFQAPSERNYHIFYQLLKGASAEQKAKFYLGSPKDYHYLTNGDLEAPGIDDVEWFNSTKTAFSTLGISQDEQDSIFQVVSSVLLLGNVEFGGEESVTIKNTHILALVAKLLGVRDHMLVEALTKRFFGGGGRASSYNIPLNKAQAIENRDALAKELYSKLFDHLVNRLNSALTGTIEPNTLFIGVLDIFGFEIFNHNSLEQFCINYTNERLHLQFNSHMFKAEQEEYEKESVAWEKITFHDNQVHRLY